MEANQLIYIDKALKKSLYKDSYWLKLLHFKDKKSTINTKEFFLSPKGNINPKKELIATITKFIINPNLICKYPARYKWLNKQINLNIKNQECKRLKKFLKPNFKNLSIVFTSQRYDSPASVFGHTMIKVETDDIPYVIDYTAKIARKTDLISYIYKGLSGKFYSNYRIMPYTIKDNEYRAGEFRDLLNFSLNLTKDEINNIMLHLYEIKKTKEEYFFLNHNCSSEVIKLIDIAKYDSKLNDKLKRLVIPIDIIYILKNNNYIEKITIQNSKLKQFYNSINRFNDKEKDILFKIIDHNYSINRFERENIVPQRSKYLIILAAIDYFEIKSIKDTLNSKDKYPYLKLIELSLKYNIESDFRKKTILDKIPISDKLHKIYLGATYSFKDKNEILIGYRDLYRNRFDLVDSMKKNGSVELLDFALRRKTNKISLEHLNIANLEAMPISNRFFKEIINKIKLGISRFFEDDKLYGYFNYGLGYRYRLNRYIDYQFYAKTGAYYHHKDIYLASLETSIEYNYKNRYIAELFIESNKYSNGVFTKNINLNNYIKITNATTINLDFKHKNKYNEVDIFYNINF